MKRVRVFVFLMIIISVTFATSALANKSHGQYAYLENHACDVCGNQTPKLSRGCSGTYIGTTKTAACNKTPSICSYVKDQYKTCSMTTHSDGTPCHSHNFAQHTHQTRHIDTSHNGGCYYR